MDSTALVWIVVLFSSPVAAINKCCPLGSHLDPSSNSCSPLARYFHDDLFKWLPVNSTTNRSDDTNYRFPNCTREFRDTLINSPERQEFDLELEHGRVALRVSHSRARFGEDDFCVDGGGGDKKFVVVVCPCTAITCLRKCCGRGRVYNTTAGECTGDVHNQEALRLDDGAYYMVDHRGECESSQLMFRQINSSNLHLLDENLKITNKSAEFFCIDSTVSKEQVMLRCNTTRGVHEKYYSEARQMKIDQYFVPLVMIGIIAIATTVSLMLWLPELHRNLHQRMVLAFNCTLLLHDTCMGVRWIGRPWVLYSSCQVIGFIHHYSLLSEIFWLNAICVDIALVFSGYQRFMTTTSEFCLKRFVRLALYAWGGPFVIVSILAVIDFTPQIHIFKPVFDQECVIQDELGSWLFLLGPIGLLLVVNCLLYIFTCVRINAVSRAVLNSADSRTHARNKENHLIVTKLFFIMLSTEGISWAAFFFGAIFGLGDMVWLVHQVLHLAAGLLIFIVFCCNRTVYRLLRGKFGLMVSVSSDK